MNSTLPTRMELLQRDLVTIDRLHKSATANSLRVAKHYDKRPSDVNRVIGNLIKKGVCKIAPSYFINQQNKQQKYYKLNRSQFLNVVMNFTGDRAIRDKALFIDLFEQMEAELSDWKTGRRIASASTKQANHQLYWLQTKLSEVIPGSFRTKMLFIHVQQAITKAATGSAKTDRAEMSCSQLLETGRLEQKASDEINRLKLAGLPPVQIRNDVLAMINGEQKGANNEISF